MTEARFVEVEVEDLAQTGEETGAVVFRERHPRTVDRPRRFMMFFQIDLMRYIKAAKDHLTQHDRPIGHGAIIRFYEDHTAMRMDHVTFTGTEEDRFIMFCHAQTPDGPVSVDTLPSDAIAVGLYAGVPFWVDEALLERFTADGEEALKIFDGLGPKSQYDLMESLEDIPDEDLPPRS